MDPKVYIFFFMVLLSIVLADYLEAYKFRDSRTIQEDSDIHLPAHKNGKTRQAVYYNHGLISSAKKKSLSKRSSNRSSKKSKKARLRNRKIRTTPKSDNENIKIFASDDIDNKNHDGIHIKRRKSGTLRRKSESIVDKQTDNSNIQINNIGLSNNAQDISIAPLTPDHRDKRKFDKKYRPEFKYIRLDKKIKKNNSLNPKTDIPDNAEGVYENSDEVYMKVLPPKIQKETRKKATEFIVQYENFEENQSVDEEKPQKEKESQERKLSKLRSKNIEILDAAVDSPRRYNPIFQYSNVRDMTMHHHPLSNDYSEVIDAGIEVIEVTTKAPETTTYGKTEIIYLTPNPENKKYKPMFKYQALGNEPYNYDIPHYRKTDKDQTTYGADNSKSESKESGETSNNQKTTVNLRNKEESDEISAKHSSEDDDSNAEEKSKEKRDSDRENDLLKISRKIRARERPTFDIKQYYNKIINENIKEQENMKQSEDVKRYERFEQLDDMGQQVWQGNRAHTRNFVRKKIDKVDDDDTDE